MAATGHGVWAQMTHLSLPVVLPGPSWTFELPFWPRTSPHPEKASGVRSSLPGCVGPGLSLEFLLLLCKASSLSPPRLPHPSAEKPGLGSRFELSLVSALHFPRRPELVLLISPQAIDPRPEDALHESGSASVRLRVCLFLLARMLSPPQNFALLALTGLLAAL